MSALRRVSRTDYAHVTESDLAASRTTPEGFLIVDAHIFRAGVQAYGMGDKRQLEYRDADKLFQPEILRRHQMLPIADDHPDVKVMPDNARLFVRGATGQDVRRDGDRGRATLIIYDAELIASMKSKKKVELSVGYDCDWDPTPGKTASGQRYDGQQLNWMPNHIAVVERGRAGNALARVDRADHLDMLAENGEKVGDMTPEEIKKLQDDLAAALAKIAELEADKAAKDAPPAADAQPTAADVAAVKADPAAAAAKLDWQRKRADSAERDLLKATRQLNELKDQLVTLKKRTDSATTASREAIKARAALDRIAAHVCPDLYEAPVNRDGSRNDSAECRADGMDDRALMCEVVEKVDGIKIPAERGIEFVKGAYEMAVARVRRSSDDYGRLDSITQPRDDFDDRGGGVDYGRGRDRRDDRDDRDRDERRRDDAAQYNGDAAAASYAARSRGMTIYGSKD